MISSLVESYMIPRNRQYRFIALVLLVFLSLAALHENLHALHMIEHLDESHEETDSAESNTSHDDDCVCYCQILVLNLDNIESITSGHSPEYLLISSASSPSSTVPECLYRPPRIG
ncbi:MAG: hypothetical protein H8E46_07670 [FCB group bacterium]|nr:hypothetical protein [FCB group bacterium]